MDILRTLRSVATLPMTPMQEVLARQSFKADTEARNYQTRAWNTLTYAGRLWRGVTPHDPRFDAPPPEVGLPTRGYDRPGVFNTAPQNPASVNGPRNRVAIAMKPVQEFNKRNTGAPIISEAIGEPVIVETGDIAAKRAEQAKKEAANKADAEALDAAQRKFIGAPPKPKDAKDKEKPADPTIPVNPDPPLPETKPVEPEKPDVSPPEVAPEPPTEVPGTGTGTNPVRPVPPVDTGVPEPGVDPTPTEPGGNPATAPAIATARANALKLLDEYSTTLPWNDRKRDDRDSIQNKVKALHAALKEYDTLLQQSDLSEALKATQVESFKSEALSSFSQGNKDTVFDRKEMVHKYNNPAVHLNGNTDYIFKYLGLGRIRGGGRAGRAPKRARSPSPDPVATRLLSH